MTTPSSSADDAALFDRVRATVRQLQQPAYTGANRCAVCTLVNVVITVVLAVLCAVVWVPLGVGVGLAGLLSIYFRGYLVPGTPTFTKRYFPRRLLDWFGKVDTRPPATPPTDDESERTLEPETVLRRVGVLTDAPAADDLRVTESFAREWRDSMARIRDRESTAAALAAVVDADPAAISFSTAEDTPRVFASVGETFLGQWVSDAALRADVASAAVLDARDPDPWTALDSGEKGAVLAALRVFVPSCPTCEEPVAFHEDETGGCCWSTPVVVLRCEACQVPLMRLDQSTVAVISDSSS
jgi:hypothetical protein